LVLATVLAVGVALPFVSGRRLSQLIYVNLAIALVIAATRGLLPVDQRIPEVVRRLLATGTSAVVLILIATVLNQFATRQRALLAEAIRLRSAAELGSGRAIVLAEATHVLTD